MGVCCCKWPNLFLAVSGQDTGMFLSFEMISDVISSRRRATRETQNINTDITA